MRFAVLADTHIGRSIPLAIAEHRRRAFSEAFTRTVDAIIEAGGDYVFTGHYHQRSGRDASQTVAGSSPTAALRYMT